MEKTSFMKNHADTVAIIGVNIAIAAVLITMSLANTSRTDASNARLDGLYNLISQEIKSFHEESKRFHGRLCVIESKQEKK